MNNLQYGYSDDRILGVLYGYYTRYIELKPLINMQYSSSRASEISIFIDVDDIFTRIDSYLPSASLEIPYKISACIINMCAHYRYFLSNSFGVNSSIVLVCSIGTNYIENKFCQEYKHPTPSLTPKETVIKILKELIVPYIPDIYISVSNYNFSSMTYAIRSCIPKFDKTMPALAISKDVTSMSLCCNIESPIQVLRPKKSGGNKNGSKLQDTSYIISSDAFWRYVSQHTKEKIETRPGDEILLPLLWSICGLPDRGLAKIQGAKYCKSTAIGLMSMYTGSIYLTEQEILSLISGLGLENHATRIINRYKVLCRDFGNLAIANGDAIMGIDMVDIYDPERLKAINEMSVFSQTPLDLNAL